MIDGANGSCINGSSLVPKKKKILCLEVPSIQFQAKGMLEAETSGGAHCFIGLYSLNPSKKKKMEKLHPNN